MDDTLLGSAYYQRMGHCVARRRSNEIHKTESADLVRRFRSVPNPRNSADTLHIHLLKEKEAF